MRDRSRSRWTNVGGFSRRGRRHDLESSSWDEWFRLRSLILLSADSESLCRIDSGRKSSIQPSGGGVQAVSDLVPDHEQCPNLKVIRSAYFDSASATIALT